MANSNKALRTSLRPRERPTPSENIGASRPGDTATRGTKALRPMADLPSAAALGKMSMAQLKRLLGAAQSSKERNLIQQAIQNKITPLAKGGMPTEGLAKPSSTQVGVKKLPEKVRNKMGYMKSGGLASSGNNDMRKGGMFK